MNNLLEFLETIIPLSEGLKEHLLTTLKHEIISKKQHLLKKGAVCKFIYFIEYGLFRCYYISESGSEMCSWFMKSGDVMISVESFFKQISSYENIQALENSSIYYMSFEDLNKTYRQFPEFNIVGRILTEQYYCQSERRLFWLRKTKASERYALFSENHPDFIQKVPSVHIASFLGISQETLSRLKAAQIRSSGVD